MFLIVLSYRVDRHTDRQQDTKTHTHGHTHTHTHTHRHNSFGLENRNYNKKIYKHIHFTLSMIIYSQETAVNDLQLVTDDN